MNYEENDEIIDDKESEDESGSNFKYLDKTRRKVFIDKTQFSIFELHRRYKRGDLELIPTYQRESGIWNDRKKSRLIESVLLNIPIPVIYLAEMKENRMETVDGQQRLSSFIEFIENKFALKSLEVMQELSNKKFRDLEKDYKELQRKFEDYQLNVFLIKKDSHPDIRFDVYRRINEGATQLNAQELRHSMFRGVLIDLLKEMAEDSSFKELVGGAVSKKRMKDKEAALRFLAFYVNGFENYKGNLNAFLNGTLKELPRDNNAYLEELKKTFSATMETILETFGKDVFIKPGSSRKKVNLSLFDIISFSFTQFEKKKILKVKDSLKRHRKELLDKKDDKFYYSITANTLTRANVAHRFETWMKIMSNCIKGGR